MTGQVDITVRSSALLDAATLETALDHAANVIYDRYQRGGPSVSGEPGALNVLLFVDTEDPGEWMPQLAVLCEAAGTVESVTVAPFVENSEAA